MRSNIQNAYSRINVYTICKSVRGGNISQKRQSYVDQSVVTGSLEGPSVFHLSKVG